MSARYVPAYGSLDIGTNEDSDQERLVEVERRHLRKRPREVDEIDDALVEVYENRCNMMNDFVVQLYRKELPTALSQQAAAQSLPVSINDKELGNVNNGSGCMSEITHCSGQKRVRMKGHLSHPFTCVCES